MPSPTAGCWPAAFLVALALPGVARAQVAPAVSLTEAERAWVVAHPKIRLMVDAHYEPADYIDDTGKHAGITADMLALLAARTGLQFEPVVLTPEQRLELDPKKRGVDGVALSAMTPKRAEFYAATTPYLVFPAYIITRRSVDHFVSPGDLVGNPVAVVSGYAAQEYLETNYPQLELVTVPDTEAGLRKVSFGEVYALVSDIPVSTYWLEKEGFTNLKIAGESGYVYRMGLTTRSDWPELHAILQKGLDSISFAERDAIRRKWLNLDYQPLLASRRFWVPVGWACIAGGSVLLAVLVWNFSLGRRVRARTRELRESEALLRTCVESASDAVLLVRPDGTIEKVWSANEQFFGIPFDKLLTQTAGEIFGTKFEETVAAARDRRAVEAVVAIHASQTWLISVTVVRMTVRGADRLYVCRDVTERRRMEDELASKRRLEAVGWLAGGVAHDFNNFLQVILGFTEMAQAEAGNPATQRGYLDEVTAVGGRARGIIRQLLVYSGRRGVEKQLVNLNDVLAGVAAVLRQVVGPAVRLDMVPSPDPVELHADVGELERILVNLFANARDAMPGGGAVRVRVGRSAFVPHAIGATTSDYAVLSVEDDGVGMTEEVRARIFEPYFTTKPAESGTGLSLAVARKVIDDHGGAIDVRSAPGKGTTFAIYLPLADLSVGSTAGGAPPAGSTPVG